MISKLRPLMALLALAGVLVTLWTLVIDRTTDPEVVTVSEQTWAAEFESAGATTDYLVTFRVSWDAGEPLALDAPSTRGFEGMECRRTDATTLSCRSHAVLASETLTLAIDASNSDGAVTVDGVEVVRQTRQAPFSGRWLTRLFMLALVFVPVIMATHRREHVSQWLLVAFSTTALLALQFWFTVALLSILLISYAVGRWYRASDQRTSRFALVWLAISTLILLFFKNFKAVIFLSFEDHGSLALVLPLGTSYFLIRLLDLQLRWHRGQLEDLTLRRYLVYLLFPGTLVAGPIEMVDTFFKNRADTITAVDLRDGLSRISVGVAKKLVLVDGILAGVLFKSGLWSDVINDPSGDVSNVVTFCIAAYLLAYLDFSAYSDIAIGLSRILGHTIGENFRWPVLAPNLPEFWRRWHMSLSGWAFRNVFFPVIATTRSQSAALVITLLTIGLWHDLSLTWVTWGLYHGVGMAVLAWWRWEWLPQGRFRSALGVIVTNLYVAGGFAFVGIRDYSLAWSVFIRYITAPIAVLI